jgi:hypothetical protein
MILLAVGRVVALIDSEILIGAEILDVVQLVFEPLELHEFLVVHVLNSLLINANLFDFRAQINKVIEGYPLIDAKATLSIRLYIIR